MGRDAKLKKTLGLFDLFSVSTGAMFSSGFFLLPGLAYAQAGPSVVLAYFFSGLLMVPAMFSIAEMATALPKAGGSYYFIDRSLGPMMGNLGGFGIYISQVLKTTFALVGIGAYTGLFLDLPIKQVAIALTIVFMLLNLFGARKSSGFQKFLVVSLVSILSFFIVQGITFIFSDLGTTGVRDTFTPFLPFGSSGLLATIGLVFVSYVGLTQVEGLAEEVKNPERNIPLGMMLALGATIAIYTIGVFVVVSVMDHTALKEDLTPIASAAKVFMGWLPGNAGLMLVVIAAFSAFASTGNAGILTASRYPLAMSRDKLIPPQFSKVNRFHVPGVSIMVTSALVIFFVLTLSAEGIAKMASTVLLVIMLLVNVSVIVLRKSKIPAYDPGFKSPLFPYMQYFGILVYGVLIASMGTQPILLTAIVLFLAFLWYNFYASKNARREGAIYHWFARMGRYQDSSIENEFMELVKEKGLREADIFDELVIEAEVLIKKRSRDDFESLLTQVSKSFGKELDLDPDELKESFKEKSPIDASLIHPQVAMIQAQAEGIPKPGLKIVISRRGIKKEVNKKNISTTDQIHVFFFLLGDAENQRQHLRLLMRLSDIIDRDDFVDKMLDCRHDQDVKEYLIHHERYISFKLAEGSPTENLIGKKAREIDIPEDTMVALVRRKNKVFTPKQETVLQKGDTLTIIGEPESIQEMYEKYY